MNLPAANSGGSASPIRSPPVHEFFLVLPDGSCIPATAKSRKIVMTQARSEARKQAKAKRMAKVAEIQMAIEDRAAARRLLRELAELERGSLRWAARFKVRVKPDKPESRTSPVEKRLTLTPMKLPKRGADAARPTSSWVVDDLGMRGIIWQQSYLGRKSPKFYRGAARANWEYDVRDEAVLIDAAGEPVIISNMGEDWVEIGAAWQAMEDASTRVNAKIQIRAIAPFDSDMSEAEMVAALTHFCETVLAPLGLPYSAVIHAPPEAGDARNFHPHIAFSLRPMRRIEAYCWDIADEVCGELDGRDGVQMLRHLWAHSMSEAAEQAQRNMRYTGFGYGARGLDLEAGEHLGDARSAMVARGDRVWAHERNLIRNARNAARRRLRDADRKVAALMKLREAAVAQMEAERQPARARTLVAVPVPGRAEPLRAAAQPSRCPVPPNGSMADLRSRPETLTPVPTRKATLPLATPDPVTRPEPLRIPTEVTATRDPFASSMTSVSVAPSRLTSAKTSSESGTFVRRLSQSRPVRPAQSVLATPSRMAQSRPPIRPAAKIWPRSPPLAVPSPSEPALKLGTSKTKELRERAEPRVLKSRPAPDLDPTLAWLQDLLAVLYRERTRRAEAKAAMRQKETGAAAGATTQRSPGLISEQTFSATPAGLDHADMPSPVSGRRDAAPDRVATAVAGVVVRPTAPPSGVAGAAHRDPRSPDRQMTRLVPGTRPAQSDGSPVASDDGDRERLDALARLDSYVGDLRNGKFDIDYDMRKALGVDVAWLNRPAVQLGLAEMRAEQQRVITAMAAEAKRRPLDFRTRGARFWPRDLDPEHLHRLDRWATDSAFQDDMSAIEDILRAAHDRRDAEQREQRAAGAQSRTDAPKLARPIPDGFGGLRDTPPPSFQFQETGPRVLVFDEKTGAPTASLLMLLRHCGEHPRRIEFAEDQRLVASGPTPAAIDTLIRMWRYNDEVHALMIETVNASRKAGKPIYPAQHAAAIYALSRQRTRRHSPAEDREIGR